MKEKDKGYVVKIKSERNPGCYSMGVEGAISVASGAGRNCHSDFDLIEAFTKYLADRSGIEIDLEIPHDDPRLGLDSAEGDRVRKALERIVIMHNTLARINGGLGGLEVARAEVGSKHYRNSDLGTPSLYLTPS